MGFDISAVAKIHDARIRNLAAVIQSEFLSAENFYFPAQAALDANQTFEMKIPVKFKVWDNKAEEWEDVSITIERAVACARIWNENTPTIMTVRKGYAPNVALVTPSPAFDSNKPADARTGNGSKRSKDVTPTERVWVKIAWRPGEFDKAQRAAIAAIEAERVASLPPEELKAEQDAADAAELAAMELAALENAPETATNGKRK